MSIHLEGRKSKRELYSDPDNKPNLIGMWFDGIFDELRQENRWVLWRLVLKGGRWAKVPMQPSGRMASSTDPTTWTSFEDAQKTYERGGFDGLGFVLGDGWAGVDLDDVRDHRGNCWFTKPEVTELIQRFGGYSDISPSCTGHKIIGKGKWNGDWHRKPFGTDGAEIEVYDSGRYFCVTGHGSRLPVNMEEFLKPPHEFVATLDIQPLLDEVLATYGPREEAEIDTDLDDDLMVTITINDDDLIVDSTIDSDRPDSELIATVAINGDGLTPAGHTLTDAEILTHAFRAKNGAKFSRLWSGDTSDCRGDASRADLALCGMLVFWTGKDPKRLDRLFRDSKLFRGKWDEKRGETTYGERTIDLVMKSATEFYEPGPKVKVKQIKTASEVEVNCVKHNYTEPESGEQTATEIILEYFRERYRPVFKVGDTIHTEDGDTVVRNVAQAGASTKLLKRLEAAVNAPLKNGNVDVEALPPKFTRWAKTAWTDLIESLPDEDTADLGADTATAETFRRLVKHALISGVTLVTGEKSANTPQIKQHLSMIGWCRKWIKPGPWKSIRDYPIWCREREIDGGELIMEVCVRVELFARLKADKRLTEMTATKWAKRAARYGVGKSLEDNRPGGKKAVTLDREFLAELVAAAPDHREEDFAPNPQTAIPSVGWGQTPSDPTNCDLGT